MELIEADLHIHSYWSKDALCNPKTILKKAKLKGLRVVAVTDHDTVKGGVEALRVSKSSHCEVLVIPGVEVKTDLGDVIALFVEEEVGRRSFYEVLDEVKSRGGIVVLPHPFRGHSMVEEMAKHVDAIEVLNARSSRKQNIMALELADKLSKPMLAGSDAHLSFEIGKARSLLRVDELELESLRKAVLRPINIKGCESTSLVHVLSTALRTLNALGLKRCLHGKLG